VSIDPQKKYSNVRKQVILHSIHSYTNRPSYQANHPPAHKIYGRAGH